jgi:hypothetical protein
MRELAAMLATEEVARDRDRLFSLSEKYQELDSRLQSLYQNWEVALEAENIVTSDK